MKSDQNELRIGLVGRGEFGTLLGHQFQRTPEAVLTSIADTNVERLQIAGKSLSIPPDGRFQDYENLLDQALVDAVVITTPHKFHYKQVQDAIDQGLSVMCEKPLAIDLDQAIELRDQVHQTEQILMVGYQRHLDESFRQAHQRYSEKGAAVESITAEIGQDWLSESKGTWRTDPAISGGGFLNDTGRHLVDAVLWTTGLKPKSVHATMSGECAEIESTAHLTIEFVNGVIASLVLYGEAKGVYESYQIWDEDGMVKIEGRNWGTRSYSVTEPDGTRRVPELNKRGEQTKAEAFVTAVRNDQKPPATAHNAVRTSAVIEAAYEAAEIGDFVSVNLP